MKRLMIILSIVFFQISMLPLLAQHAKCDKQDCQSMMKLKRDYIKAGFALQESQVTDFWNAYQKMEDAEYQAYKSQQEARAEAGIPKHISKDSIKNLTDDQIKIFYKTRFQTKRKVLQAEEVFFDSLTTILSAKQIENYYTLERSFKRSAVRKNSDSKCKKAN